MESAQDRCESSKVRNADRAPSQQVGEVEGPWSSLLEPGYCVTLGVECFATSDPNEGNGFAIGDR
jgi:hypothetical protein